MQYVLGFPVTTHWSSWSLLTKIHVGNLPVSATDAEVRELFSRYGTVESVKLIDGDTGRPRGFAFVEVSGADAARVIENLNEQGARRTAVARQ